MKPSALSNGREEPQSNEAPWGRAVFGVLGFSRRDIGPWGAVLQKLGFL